MNFHQKSKFKHSQIKIDNHLPKIGQDEIRSKIITGLQDNPKRISSMFFYDAKGSKLFEEITILKEYYQTRTEKKLLHKIASEMGPTLMDTNIIELGSGDCSKISILLNGIPKKIINTIHYTPVDISQSAIEESAQNLLKQFPNISIHGIVADFNHQLNLIPQKDNHLFCFFGSTIGNFTTENAQKFFKEVAHNMHEGDRFLLGVDMVKEISIMEKAYNDNKQITDEFNKNILNVINSLIETDFNPDNFKHLAFYNNDKSRIEMHLVAKMDMDIKSHLLQQPIHIKKNEKIHTENSHKFTLDKISTMAKKAGLKIIKTNSDKKEWFSLITMIKQ